MKTKFYPSALAVKGNGIRRGFTLIELLVVMAIIGILSSVGFVAFKKINNNGKKTQAHTTAVQIATACEEYHAEYGHYPPTDNDSFTTTGTDGGTTFINALTGEDNEHNSKGIKFLTLNNSKNKRNGIRRDNGGEAKEILDPWGKPYRVQLDFDYDEKITVARYNNEVVHKSVVVSSDGVDGSDDADDVKSWK